MKGKADIVVIGGGISGCAIFYELSRLPISVMLIEAHEVAGAITGESGGYIRKFNLDPYLADLASESFDYYQSFSELVGGSCEFRKVGLTSRIALSTLDITLKGQIVALQEGGHEMTVSATAPGDSLKKAGYGDGEGRGNDAFIYEPTLGHIDTRKTCQSFVNAACKLGATALEHTRVEKLLVESGRIKGVVTAGGDIIQSDQVVLSAGPWTKNLLTDLPINPESLPDITDRSFQYNVYADAAKYLDTAFMDNIEGFYLAPFRNGDVFAGTLGLDRVVEGSFNHPIDKHEAERLHNAVEKRFPWVNESGAFAVKRSYDAYTADGRGLVTGLDDLAGLTIASGWSSGGIKSAPAIARRVSQLLQAKVQSEACVRC